MKILFINNTYKRIGGAEVYIYDLMKHLRSNGHETCLFAIDPHKEIKNNNLYVFRDKYNRSIKKYFFYYYFNPSLYSMLKEFIDIKNPDIIHLNNNGAFASSVLLCLKSLDIPIIQTVHDHSLICPSRLFIRPNGGQCSNAYGLHCVKEGCLPLMQYTYTRIPEYIKNNLLSKIDLFIAPSRVLRHRLLKNGFSNTIYLPNFVNVDKFSYKTPKNEEEKLLFVGRLSEEKGVCYLLKAVKELMRQKIFCILNIIGDGPAKQELEALASDLGINGYVHFHGRVSDNELISLYQESSIVVIPSIWMENSPIVAYEAMATGKPIIGSNIGGIPDLVIDGETGYLVEPRNFHQIADRIMRLISDRDLMHKMGSRAREICVSDYSMESHCNKLLDIYRMLQEEKVKDSQ